MSDPNKKFLPIQLFFVFKNMKKGEEGEKTPIFLIEYMQIISEELEFFMQTKNNFKQFWNILDPGARNVLIVKLHNYYQDHKSSKEVEKFTKEYRVIFKKDENNFYYMIGYNKDILQRRTILQFQKQIEREITERADELIQELQNHVVNYYFFCTEFVLVYSFQSRFK